jgi:hypothetical protein
MKVIIFDKPTLNIINYTRIIGDWCINYDTQNGAQIGLVGACNLKTTNVGIFYSHFPA